MKVTVETVIDAPRASVFKRLLDVESWPDVITAIEKIEILTSGPIGVGTVVRETRNMFGRSASENMTFSEIVPNQKFVLTAQSNGTAYRTEHLFKDTAGGTHMTVIFEGKPVTMASWLMMPVAWMMAGSLRNMLADDLADIKATVERAAHQST